MMLLDFGVARRLRLGTILLPFLGASGLGLLRIGFLLGQSWIGIAVRWARLLFPR